MIREILRRFNIGVYRPGNMSLYDPKTQMVISREGLTYSNDLLYTYHSADFLKDPLFMESYRLGKDTDGGLMLKNYDIEWRIHVLCWAASHAVKLEGDFVDCGVSTGIFARAVINYVGFEHFDKKYYLLDTFEGLDPIYSTEKELARYAGLSYGKENSTYDNVRRTFRDFNVEIIKGSIPGTLSRVKTDKVCFLSVDMNCVLPEFEALNFFWDRIVSGGMIILDDYGYANSHTEQKQKHDEFAESKGVKILSLPTCQGLIIKP